MSSRAQKRLRFFCPIKSDLAVIVALLWLLLLQLLPPLLSLVLLLALLFGWRVCSWLAGLASLALEPVARKISHLSRPTSSCLSVAAARKWWLLDGRPASWSGSVATSARGRPNEGARGARVGRFLCARAPNGFPFATCSPSPQLLKAFRPAGQPASQVGKARSIGRLLDAPEFLEK